MVSESDFLGNTVVYSMDKISSFIVLADYGYFRQDIWTIADHFFNQLRRAIIWALKNDIKFLFLVPHRKSSFFVFSKNSNPIKSWNFSQFWIKLVCR